METIHSIRINKLIAKLYIVLLTVRMISPLSGLEAALHGAGVYFDVILHVLGLTLGVIENGGRLYLGDDEASSLVKFFSKLVVWFSVSSIIMAIVIQITYGNYAGESAFSGIIGQIVYYIQYLLMIVYNIYLFNILSKEEIDKAIGFSCIFLLCLGYYQLLMYLIGNPFVSIARSIDIWKVLFPPETMYKLSLTATEGAKAGGVFAILVLPYLLAKITTEDSTFSYYLQLVLWVPVVVFMQSTSAYLMVSIEVLCYIIFSMATGEKQRMRLLKTILVLLLLGTIMIAILPNDVLSSIFNIDEMSYLILEKISDQQNGSTVLRLTPFIVNWKSFLRYPLIGVGNGLQGYFYIEYFPKEALRLGGVSGTYYMAQRTIVNGSLFFPSILSGYGIIGSILFLYFINRMVRVFHYKMKYLGLFGTYFRFAAIAILVHGFQTEFSGSYFIWFILSIPFMTVDNDELLEVCS